AVGPDRYEQAIAFGETELAGSGSAVVPAAAADPRHCREQPRGEPPLRHRAHRGLKVSTETGMSRNLVSRIRLIVYSDYLCPWCYNASIRLRRLEEEMAPDLEVVWRSYLLRPEPKARPVDKFRAYTESWKVPAAEEDSGSFRPWA